MDDRSLSGRVSPFRDPWITAYVQLPTAFRSLSRLSSALSAKASTLRSFLLDLVMSTWRITSLWRSCSLTCDTCTTLDESESLGTKLESSRRARYEHLENNERQRAYSSVLIPRFDA